MTAELSEFDLIKTYFEGLGPEADTVSLGIGDDCAVIDVPDGMSLCLSLDTMVEGVHFPFHAPPKKLAYRALAAATSDLAAMGAQPSHFSMSLTLPGADPLWLSEFSSGLKLLADRFHFPLVGGDTTKGPLTIGFQVHGLIPKGQALTRFGAQVGDVVAVTGNLGDAGGALKLLDLKCPNKDQAYLLDRYYYPSPRIQQGIQLRRYAHACIDISDGLLSDAAHIAEQSRVEIEIHQANIPVSNALRSVFPSQAGELALCAGDDYELLFTLSEQNWNALVQQESSAVFTKIGRVNQGSGIGLLNNGIHVDLTKHYTHKGYKHFE